MKKVKAPSTTSKRPTWRDMTDAEIYRRQFTRIRGLSRAESLCPTDRTVWNYVDDSNRIAHEQAAEIIAAWRPVFTVVIL